MNHEIFYRNVCTSKYSLDSIKEQTNRSNTRLRENIYLMIKNYVKRAI